MTTVMESLDGGRIDTGFWGPDTSKIQLGDLPLMTTQQFVGYAAQALVDGYIPHMKPAERQQLAGHTHELTQRLEITPLKKVTGKFFALGANQLSEQINDVSDDDRDELLDAIAAAVVPTEEAVYYRESPFRFQEDGQRVGLVHDDEVRHVVDSKQFFYLAYHVINGGYLGWNAGGTYQEVKDAATMLDDALSCNPKAA